jgi:hypothetical protein
MLTGVLRYRVLRIRERWQALLGGMRILRMYRSGDPRLAAGTVADVLGALGQSRQAQASFWNPVAIATLNESPQRAAALPFAAVLARAFFGSRRDSQFVLPGVGLSELYARCAAIHRAARGRVEPHAAALSLGRPTARRRRRARDGRRHPVDACIAALPPRALARYVCRCATPPRLIAEQFGGSPIVSSTCGSIEPSSLMFSA